MLQARGSFEVNLNPLEQDARSQEASMNRMSIDKQFEGDLQGESFGQMLTAMTSVETSAGYVAVEHFSGVLHGRRGSFTLQHNAIMTRGAPQLNIVIVPDSGTDELRGIAGSMSIDIRDGAHHYELTYTLDRAGGNKYDINRTV